MLVLPQTHSWVLRDINQHRWRHAVKLFVTFYVSVVLIIIIIVLSQTVPYPRMDCYPNTTLLSSKCTRTQIPTNSWILLFILSTQIIWHKCVIYRSKQSVSLRFSIKALVQALLFIAILDSCQFANGIDIGVDLQLHMPTPFYSTLNKVRRYKIIITILQGASCGPKCTHTLLGIQ